MAKCGACVHRTHIGHCGEPLTVQGVESECMCFQSAGLGQDPRALRIRARRQERKLEQLKRTGYAPSEPLRMPTEREAWHYKLPWEEDPDDECRQQL